MNEVTPTVHKLDVVAGNEVPFRIVFCPTGMSEGRPAANKYNKDDRPIVEFYDRRYDHTPEGQFVCCYYVDTLLNPEPSGGAFLLWTDVPAWRLDGATMAMVVTWLRRFAP